MNILWIKTAGLVPADTGGKIRSYNILRELARRHSVTLFTFYAAHEPDINPTLSTIFSRVICKPLRLPKPKSLGEFGDYAARAVTLQPYNITKYCRREVRRELHNVLAAQAFDVIVCDFLAPAAIIPWNASCAKVIFTHNVETVIWKRHYEVARNPLWKLLSFREWQTMKRAERKYLRLADHVLTVSETDRKSFLSFLAADKLTVVPTGVDCEYFKPSDQQEIANSIVFIGSMDWIPNEDAVWYFTQEILPLIRREISDASLCVVGRNPSSRLQAMASRETGLTVTGWVDDVRPYLARSAVCVVPLRVGGGTRIKICEAMAMGKAVVSTPIGAEGLSVIDGQNILLARNAVGFAQAVATLLRDAKRRNQIGQAAHRFASENYSWSMAADVFADVLARAARERYGDPVTALSTPFPRTSE